MAYRMSISRCSRMVSNWTPCRSSPSRTIFSRSVKFCSARAGSNGTTTGSDSSAASTMSEDARPKAENAEATGPSGTTTSVTPTSAA